MAYMLENRSLSGVVCYWPQTTSMIGIHKRHHAKKMLNKALPQSTFQFQLRCEGNRIWWLQRCAEHFLIHHSATSSNSLTYCIPTSTTTKLWAHRPADWKGAAPIPPTPYMCSIFHTCTTGKITGGKYQSCCRR